MKKLVMLIMLMLFAGAIVNAAVENTIPAVINEYYDAFAKEDMNRYLSVQYLEGMDTDGLELKKSNINAIWNSLNTDKVKVSGLKFETNGNMGIATYDVDATLSENDKSFSYKMSMTAVLINSLGWKIYSVVPTAQFDAGIALESGNINIEMPIESVIDDNKTPITHIVNEDVNKTEDFVLETNTESKDGIIKEKTVSCDYDKEALRVKSFSLSDIPQGERFGNNKKVLLKVDDQEYSYEILDGIVKSSDVAEEYNFKVEMNSCTMANLLLGANPLVEYNEGRIKISGGSAGNSVVLGIGKILLWFYNLFTSSPQEIWVEAETGTLENKGAYSFIAATSRGPGELYLGDGNAAGAYLINAQKAGTYKLYISISDDAKHPNGARNANIIVNDIPYKYNHISKNTITDKSAWNWIYVADIGLVKGKNNVKFVKEKTTSAAFVMDKFIFSEKELSFD